MYLRPHHLLCIQKFTGHGYNAEFTAQMQSVVSALKEHPKTPITVTTRCDDLCKKCPNRLNGICTSEKKVALMDSAVLQVCGFSDGESVLFEAAAKKAREEIFKTEKFDHICARCAWFALCGRTEV